MFRNSNFGALCNHRADHHKRASRSRLDGVQPVGHIAHSRHKARRPRWRRCERGKTLGDATLAAPPDRLGIANRVRSPPIFFPSHESLHDMFVTFVRWANVTNMPCKDSSMSASVPEC